MRKIQFAEQILEELKQRFPNYRETPDGIAYPLSQRYDIEDMWFNEPYQVGEEQCTVIIGYSEFEIYIIKTGLTPLDKSKSLLNFD